MRPTDGAVAEGTEATDSLKVTRGVPVKRLESSDEVDLEAGEGSLPPIPSNGADQRYATDSNSLAVTA